MALMLSTLGAIMLTVFGNQSLLIDGTLRIDAMSHSEALTKTLENRATDDFNLVNPIAATTTSDGYTTSAGVMLLPDYRTKEVTATTSWRDALGQTRSFALTTLITNFEHAIGADTCDSTLTGDWSAPDVETYVLAHNASINDIDVYGGRLFAVVGSKLLIFDAETALVASFESATTTESFSAIRMAGQYAYLANSSGESGQLQIVDVNSLSIPTLVTNYLLPTSTPAFVIGTDGQAVGKSLAYDDGLLYLGLSKTATGPEFNILDVRNPNKPVWLGGYSVGRGVNAIALHGRYAYLATDDNETGGKALIMLDVSNPAKPLRVATWSGDGAGFAKSLAIVGDTLYLGRTYLNGAQKEFETLDARNLTPLKSVDIGTASHHAGVQALRIRDSLAFLLTTDDLEIWDSVATSTVALPTGSRGVALDCEGNTLYAASVERDTSYLTVLTAH